MTSDNELRDRIAHLLHGHFELTAIGPIGCRHEYWSDEEHVAQAIIDELGLTVELRADRVMPSPDPLEFDCIQRVVGKWEKQ